MDTEPPAGRTHIDHLQRRSQPGEGGHEVSQTNARRRSLVLLLGLLASFAVLWIAASAGDRAQAQQNTPATGTVTITGTVGIGELLTAHASGITDADGLTNPNFFFLWLAGATSDPTDATGRLFAYEERYHVLPFDAGLRIMVAVSFYDDAGNFEAIYSVATGVVATVAPAPPSDLTASSTAPGELSLRWQGPSWTVKDWLDERSNVGNGGSDITGYKVQWKRSTKSWNVPADVSEEAAAGETHTITNLTGGQTYTLRVIATNGVGDSQSSREITRAVNRFPTGAPTITGTPRVGEVLTVDASGITDEDGLTNPRFGYGWQVAPEPSNDILLRLYGGPNYPVRPVDVGRTIQARVSFIDDANFTQSLLSTPTPVPSDGDGSEQTSPGVAKPTHLPEPSASTSGPDASSTASPSPPSAKGVATPAPTRTSVAARAVAPTTVPATAPRGPAPAGASDPPASEIVEEGEPEAAGSGQPAAAPRDPDRNEVLYTWDDGGRTRRAWLQTDLAVQPSTDNASDDVVVRRGDSESIVKRQAGDARAESNPVFRTASGALMTLPGGVLLLLDPEWDQARVDRFFFENAVAKTRVSDREFGENAFFVETAPGYAALELANTLAGQEGVLISSPNWSRTVELN